VPHMAQALGQEGSCAFDNGLVLLNVYKQNGAGTYDRLPNGQWVKSLYNRDVHGKIKEEPSNSGR